MSFSFTPTQPIEAGGANQPHDDGMISSVTQPTPASTYTDRFSGMGMSLVQVILCSLLGITIVTAGTLFWYQSHLISQIADKKILLQQEEGRLGALPLDAMKKLSNRMKVIDTLLKGHASVRVAFRVIEDSIEDPVTYKNFNLQARDGANSYVLELAARAESYHAVIQQAETFKSKVYSNFIPKTEIEGVHPDDLGGIAFTIKMPIVITGVLPEAVVFGSDAPAPALQVATSSTVALVTGTATVVSTSSLPIVSAPKKP